MMQHARNEMVRQNDRQTDRQRERQQTERERQQTDRERQQTDMSKVVVRVLRSNIARIAVTTGSTRSESLDSHFGVDGSRRAHLNSSPPL